VGAGRGVDFHRRQVPALDAEDEAGAREGRFPGDAKVQAFEAVRRRARQEYVLPPRLYSQRGALVYDRRISYSKSMNGNSLIRRPFRYDNRNLSIWLIAINVLVFALEYLIPYTYPFLAMTPSLVLSGAFWQPFTYMFVHDPQSFTHILWNMLGLLFFGTAVERELGSKEFLLYYLLTGLLAGLFSLAAFLAMGTDIRLLGASGAVFAVQLAFATLQPNAQIYIWGILPLRAPILVLGFTGIELFSQVFGSRSGVAHLTHLAGFAFGWIYFLARFGVNPWRRFFPRGR
jgi:membrane associated rhomboid family serine protease